MDEQLDFSTFTEDTVDPRVNYSDGTVEAGIQLTSWQQFTETMRKVSGNSPLGFMPGEEGAWSRWAVQREFEDKLNSEGKKKLTPDEANKKYPGMPVPFDTEMHEQIAYMQWNDQQRRKAREDMITKSGKMGGFSNFVAEGTAMFDPAIAAVNLLTAGTFKAFGVAQKAVPVFAENLAGNILTDIPTYAALKEERQAVTMADTLYGSIASATFGTALHVGLGKLATSLESIRKKTSTAQQEVGINAAKNQHENGFKIDMEPLTAVASSKLNGVTVGIPEEIKYKFKNFESPEGVALYGGIDPEHGPIEFDNYGGVRQTTDNDFIANNRVSNVDGIATGELKEITLDKSTNLVNLDDALDSPTGKSILSKFQSLGIDTAEIKTVKELLDAVNDVIYTTKGDMDLGPELIAKGMQELGYDGYKYVDGAENKHNVVGLYNESKIVNDVPLEASKEISPKVGHATIEKLKEEKGPTERVGFNEKNNEEIERLKGIDSNSTTVEKEVLANTQAQVAATIEGIEHAEVRADMEAKLNEIRESKAVAERTVDGIQKIAQCLLRNIT